jgi:hypothetical protein
MLMDLLVGDGTEHCGKTEEHFDESDDGAEDQGFDLAALVDNGTCSCLHIDLYINTLCFDVLTGEQDDEQVSTALAESLAQRRAALVSQQQVH